jgi:hypothetical protein
MAFFRKDIIKFSILFGNNRVFNISFRKGLSLLFKKAINFVKAYSKGFIFGLLEIIIYTYRTNTSNLNNRSFYRLFFYI